MPGNYVQVEEESQEPRSQGRNQSNGMLEAGRWERRSHQRHDCGLTTNRGLYGNCELVMGSPRWMELKIER